MDNFIIQNEAVRVKIGINFDSLIPTLAPRPHIPNKSTPPLTHGKLLIPSSGRDCHFLTFSIISRANNSLDLSENLLENIPNCFQIGNIFWKKRFFADFLKAAKNISFRKHSLFEDNLVYCQGQRTFEGLLEPEIWIPCAFSRGEQPILWKLWTSNKSKW